VDDRALGIVEVRKVDPQGRLVLPAERRGELGESRRVILVKGPGFIKLIPKRKADLRRFYNSADLGIDAIDEWSEFEKKIHRLRNERTQTKRDLLLRQTLRPARRNR
jgi:DNA-binding transcriptional regulator/RsmH inhibitor MraZ